MNKYKLFFVLIVMSSFLCVSGCETTEVLFGDPKEPPLQGERLSVLQYQDELEPDPVLASSQINLPESWNNSFWPQTGGYPSHSMGHLQLSEDLKKQWSVSIGKGNSKANQLSVQPVLADGMIFTIDSRARLMAFDANTGKRKWKFDLTPEGEEDRSSSGGGIAFSEGTLFVAAGYKEILSINPENGDLIWRVDTSSPTRSSPAVLGGRLFVITLDNHILAYDSKNGKQIWSYAGVANTTNLLGSSSPAVDKDVVIATLSSGEILALRTENGHVLWQDNLSSLRQIGALPGISDIRGLPVIDRGIIYVIGSSGKMIAIDEQSGRRIWHKEIGGAETPWAVGDTVFTLTSNQQLVALNRQSGKIYWVSKLPRFADKKGKSPMVWTGPLLGGGSLIIASNSGHLLHINPYNGKIDKKWKFSKGAVVPPIISNGRLYILNQDAKLTAYGQN